MLNNASAATVQAPPYTSERQRTLATLVVSIALVLEIIDVSIINVAIPVVQRDLLASPRQIEWVVTGYLFFFSILLLTGGRLGDLYGYRRLFISGLLAFGAASAGCGLAASPEMLVAMRIAQGASGAMMGPQILSLMQVLYRPHERFRVMSIFGLLGGAAGILGPVLGGIIIESNLFGLSWRPIFLINVPVIVVAVALAWRALPAVRSPEAKGIDPLGTLLAVVGGGALLLTLIEGPALRWPLWMALPPLLSLITVSLLWRHLLGRERRGGTLLLPPAMLRDRFFRAGIVITLLYQLTTASLLLATALVLQSGLGFSPFHTALLHIPFALGAMFSIAVAGRRLSPRLGRNVTLVGVAVQMSGLLLMGYGIATAPGTLALTALGLGFGLCGCGMGLISAPLPAFAMAAIPVAHAGAASGLFRTGQQFGAALGMATLGGFYLAQSASAPDAWRGAFITLLTLGALILLAIAALSRLLPVSVLPPAGKP
ncbi:major facilitator superfamily transporter [Klebsiella quasipneumoniae]|uniref:MFS transporter n=1 Tax=Klebsiella quasipneumoniae TaxID=1463165 RepID=UPI0009BA6555|nr:MFS transporter [Klebsiella quasipneumoniae]SLX32238.1 major facilitator superfamily transporter [Klebsiella quasipneumoniae]SLX37412.1 major facilitator superfamily transporter [Klebsiella quasipneumoniae]SLX40876.1 major facilitator superfamily transporter [Klebsiella quasipneumoniae]SLX43761.1 major facilitator superfamily transporter [Klebsiella quasipneumoniae]SLX57234.1 major facilitator superfamily transporter [Klebsiella quasipneumoniae]